MGTKGAQVLKAANDPKTLRDLLNAALKRQDERAAYLNDSQYTERRDSLPGESR